MLAAVGLARGARLRHEALLCLTLIRVVLLLDPRRPLQVAEPVWWTVCAVGLLAYLLLRRNRLTDR